MLNVLKILTSHMFVYPHCIEKEADKNTVRGKVLIVLIAQSVISLQVDLLSIPNRAANWHFRWFLSLHLIGWSSAFPMQNKKKKSRFNGTTEGRKGRKKAQKSD